MPGTVARVTELSARSDTGFEDAVKVWIKEQSVDVENGQVVGYRVNLLVTFVLE